MVEENLKLRIKRDPLFAFELVSSEESHSGKDNIDLEYVAFEKLVSIGIIDPLDFEDRFELDKFHLFNPSHDLCHNLLESLDRHAIQGVLEACIFLSYNDLFYKFKGRVFIASENEDKKYKKHYYYAACKANNTEIMKSEYTDDFEKDLCFDYSTYIFN